MKKFEYEEGAMYVITDVDERDAYRWAKKQLIGERVKLERVMINHLDGYIGCCIVFEKELRLKAKSREREHMYKGENNLFYYIKLEKI